MARRPGIITRSRAPTTAARSALTAVIRLSAAARLQRAAGSIAASNLTRRLQHIHYGALFRLLRRVGLFPGIRSLGESVRRGSHGVFPLSAFAVRARRPAARRLASATRFTCVPAASARRVSGIGHPICRPAMRLASLGRGRLARAITIDIRTRLLFASDLQEPARLGLFQQIAERAEAIVGLVEIRFAALQGVFQGRCPDLAAVAAFGHQRLERLDHHLDRARLAGVLLFLAAALLVGRAALGAGAPGVAPCLGGALAFTGQIVVEDEFVAVGDEQVRGGLLDAHADDLLIVLAQLGHQRRKIGVAADDDEGVDVGLGVAEVQRVHDQADVGRILARLTHVRDFDQFEIGLVHGRLEFLVALPVAIGLLDDDAALEQQALEHRPDVELLEFGVAHTQRHVLEVAEKRHADVFVGVVHVLSNATVARAKPGLGDRQNPPMIYISA